MPVTNAMVEFARRIFVQYRFVLLVKVALLRKRLYVFPHVLLVRQPAILARHFWMIGKLFARKKTDVDAL